MINELAMPYQGPVVTLVRGNNMYVVDVIQITLYGVGRDESVNKRLNVY